MEERKRNRRATPSLPEDRRGKTHFLLFRNGGPEPLKIGSKSRNKQTTEYSGKRQVQGGLNSFLGTNDTGSQLTRRERSSRSLGVDLAAKKNILMVTTTPGCRDWNALVHTLMKEEVKEKRPI